MPIKTLTNVVVTYNGTDISAYLNQASLEIVRDAIDTTTMASDGHETTPAAPGFSVPIAGLWARSLDVLLGVDAATRAPTPRALSVAIGPSESSVEYERTASGNYGAFVNDYKIDASDPLGLIAWSATLSVSGIMAVENLTVVATLLRLDFSDEDNSGYLFLR